MQEMKPDVNFWKIQDHFTTVERKSDKQRQRGTGVITIGTGGKQKLKRGAKRECRDPDSNRGCCGHNAEY